MQSLTFRGLVRRRVASSRWLLASVLAGVVAAATLVSAVPVYVSSLTQLSINLEIDNLGRSGTTAYVFTNNLILTKSRFGEIEQIVDEAVDRYILPAYDGRERILSTHSLWIEVGETQEQIGTRSSGGNHPKPDQRRHLHQAGLRRSCESDGAGRPRRSDRRGGRERERP